MTGPVEVLVVDDDFMVARIHTGFVHRTDGFTPVGTASTGAEALRMARELAPDLVLLDVHLPDMSGLDVLARLREEAPEVDVIVVSAAREADTVRRAWRGGAVHYLLKPFAYDDLRARLEDYASASGALEEGLAAQEDVDRLFGVGGRAATRELPKGMSAETAGLVAGALRSGGDSLSAAECAAVVGVSRVSARRYLEHFVATGRAAVRLRYGGTGRPERRYAWTG